MGSRLMLTRKFLVLYGVSGIWAALGGGILLLAGGEAFFGSLVTAIGVVLIVLLVDGRFIREGLRTGVDLAVMYLPVIGVVAGSGLSMVLFPRLHVVILYTAVYVVLALLPLGEIWLHGRQS